MNDVRDPGEMLYALQGLSLARNLPIPEVWGGLEMFVSLLDDIRQDRALFLLKLIPQPNAETNAPYVASVAGGLLWDGGAPIVVGDDMMERALARAILEYARRCWHFEW
jgi:hypothetical protein